MGEVVGWVDGGVRGEQVDLPAVAVGRVHVDPELHQELDDLRVPGAHGVVQGDDALVVGLTGVLHLTGPEKWIACPSIE